MTRPMPQARSSSLELLPVVIVDNPSKHFSTLYTPLNVPQLPMERHRYLLSDTLVWSSSVVVPNILQEHSLQMSLIHDYYAI